MTETAERLRLALADRYVIEREVGQGGMATVYVAHDVRHDRRVALKVLRAELAAVIGAERFLAEIKTTATLQHPHILPLFDSGTADGFLYYVMPYVEGESLRDRLSREKQLPVDEAVRVASEVAGALDYAHRHGVVHRDIKPENILLHEGQALVADFGIALAVSRSEGATRMTETGMSLGTPHYMSPEQAMGEREITPKADVYALGCVLYEMLLGEPPFTGPTAQAIVAKVMTEKPGPIVARRDRVPAHVEDAVFTALEKLPADRFASAAEFAAELTGSRGAAVPRAAAVRRSWLVPVATVGAVALAAGFLLGHGVGSPAALPTEWRGELLGGPQVAMAPTVSRDGQLVAFEAMVDGQTQLGVLKPQSGDWKVLTSDRSRGLVSTYSWSRDDSKIYFDRVLDRPNGVYSISPLGSEERPVLADAMFPDVLPDGSLLVARLNADRNVQLYRFWPESGRLDTLDAIGVYNPSYGFFRSFPDGKEAAFYGRPASQKDSADNLYAINLASNRVRRLAPRLTAVIPALAMTPDGRWVVVASSTGALQEIIAVARDGSNRTQVLASLTSPSYGLDVGTDRSLYFDQYARPSQLMRFAPSGGHMDSRPLPALERDNATTVLPLPDGRTLVAVLAGGGSRVMTVAPGKEPSPFLGTAEETDGPLALVGGDRVALMLGTGADRAIAIASIATGQLLHRLPGLHPKSLAGSPDGTTIYYVASNAVWAVPAGGGRARRIHAGAAVAADPGGRYLIVEVDDTSRAHLIRVPLDGGAESEIAVTSALRVAAGSSLSSNAVGVDGRIVVQVAPPSSWFWPAAILDPKTGKLDVLPPGVSYDMRGGWSSDGHVVYYSLGLESTLWRFRPVTAKGGQ